MLYARTVDDFKNHNIYPETLALDDLVETRESVSNIHQYYPIKEESNSTQVLLIYSIFDYYTQNGKTNFTLRYHQSQ